MKSRTTSRSAGGGGGVVNSNNDRKALRRERRLLVKTGRRRRAERLRQRAEARRRRGGDYDGGTKKRSRRVEDDGDVDVAGSSDFNLDDRGGDPGRRLDHEEEEETRRKKKKSGVAKSKRGDAIDAKGDPYGHLDPSTAAAMRADDEEIAALERKLGLISGASSDAPSGGDRRDGKKNKKRDKLLREYEAEGYGEDFGRFLLDDLDGILSGGVGGGLGDAPGDRDGDYQREWSSEEKEEESAPGDYSDADESGEEIVPMKGGAYEEDSSDSSDVPSAERGNIRSSLEDGPNARGGPELSDDEDDEDDHSDDSSSSDGGVDAPPRGRKTTRSSDDEESSSRSSTDGTDEDDDEEEGGGGEEEEDDHPASDTYRPTSGEDIYGNVLDGSAGSGTKPTRYVPPHLRRAAAENKSVAGSNHEDGGAAASSSASSPHRSRSSDERNKEEEREIRRSIQGTFNRLSSETMESSAKFLAGLYDSHPNGTMNACLADQLCRSCGISSDDGDDASVVVLMSSLIPTVAATVAAVHVMVGDNSVGSTLVERVTLEYVSAQDEARRRCRASGGASADDEDDAEFTYSKRSSNAALVLCYLYNFDVVHCSFIYGLVRDLISTMTEVDAEVLLLVLRHAGRRMRGDDPSSLRDIMGLVQKRCRSTSVSGEGGGGGDDDDEATAPPQKTTVSSSRMRCMIDAMTDLRNNKRRRGDEGVSDTIAKYRKFVGRVKSTAGDRGAADPCLRMTMRDILDMEKKGRWWRVGASWRGNQYRDDGAETSVGGGDDDGALEAGDGKEPSRDAQVDRSLRGGDGDDNDDELLRLASKMRMNTDLRRSIFCVVMGSADCDDAFEKLVGFGLRGRQERDVVRVIMECCGRERSYNPFYAVLSARLCEHHGRNFRFTFQKTFWDLFDQFDTMKARRAANLAKLYLHLVREGMLSIDMLRVLDVTDVPEAGVIFLTMFFFGMFETFDPSEVSQTFASGFAKDATKGGALRESLSVFLLQYVKRSPKNVKKSKFHANYNAAMEACDVAA